MNRKSRRLMVISVLLTPLLAACIPHARVFHQVEAPGAVHSGEICRVGARAVSRFPIDGLEVVININPVDRLPWLWLLTDPADVLSLDQPFVSIELVEEERSEHLQFHPYRTVVLADGRLEGEYHSRLERQVYRFRADRPLKPGRAGEIVFPELSLNGQTVAPARHRYTRRHFLGVLPLNC